MRAIDYLQSRAEIDPRRIGCTGISGGGTLTSYLMALDDRIVAAAPGCYLTNIRRLMETIGAQDAEQNIHAQIAFGMDHPDYVLARAPQPTLIMTATRDFFDIAGSWATFRQAKRWYGRLGLAERVDLFETDGPHGFPGPMRVASARWMSRWLLGHDDAITELESPVARDEELRCTPRGEVMLIPGARSTYDLNIAMEERLAESRRALWRRADKPQMLAQVRRIAGIAKLDDLPRPQCEKTATLRRPEYRIDKLILRPEPGIVIPGLAFVPDQPSGLRHLYLHAAGKQRDAGPGGPIEKMVRARQMVLAVDLRGMGETAATSKAAYSDYFGPDWQDMFLAYMLDRSYLAMRVEDVLVCARFLAGYGRSGGTKSVSVTGNPGTDPAILDRPAGPTDPDVTILAVQDAKSRKPLALLANYSLHYVGGTPRAMISADYYGEFARLMRWRMGGDDAFVAMMSNGTSGDINNIPFRVKRPPREPFEQIRIVAQKAADAAWFARAVTCPRPSSTNWGATRPGSAPTSCRKTRP